MVGLLITEVREATATRERVWLHSTLADPAERLWSLEVDGRLIGNCALHLRGEQGAELGVLIGERDARGRGYGTDTVRQLLAIAFGELRLWRVWLQTRGVGVRPAWQRRGIARALLAELERRLLAQGCRFVNLMFSTITRRPRRCMARPAMTSGRAYALPARPWRRSEQWPNQPCGCEP